MPQDARRDRKWLIGITDHIDPPYDIEQEAFPDADFVSLPDWRESEQNRKIWQGVDAILVWHWRVDKQTIDVLNRCRIIVRYGVGYDLIDLDALKQRDIPLSNTPDYGTEEVADTACAMILAFQRKVVLYDRACRYYTDGWYDNLLKPHQRTSDQTLGIIGVGRIGTAVVNRMKPFGYTICGYDPYQPSGHEKAIGYNRADSLEELLDRSDIVSIHCPLTEETRAMVNDDFIRRMKKGSSLINTARGGIIESLDCIERALRRDHLASVGFDVLPDEPPKEHPLILAWRNDESWISGRMIVNPHSAYYSERGWYEMRYKAAETARLFLKEAKLRNKII
ncbi:MAG: C-terminal binding protein [Planctomycetota bacterium]|jgi:D-3-phosphoglycerate dehydrogenase